MLFFVLICISFALDKHTSIYQDIGSSNWKYQYFDDRTFGYKLYTDPCKQIDNTKFRAYVNANLACTGKWCKDDAFSCGSERKDCYHVEHIIDLNGPEYLHECKSIVGNLVMSYDRWNEGLGGIAKNDYTSAQKEKTMIYGIENMKNVRNTIEKCCFTEHKQPIITKQEIFDFAYDWYVKNCDEKTKECQLYELIVDYENVGNGNMNDIDYITKLNPLIFNEECRYFGSGDNHFTVDCPIIGRYTVPRDHHSDFIVGQLIIDWLKKWNMYVLSVLSGYEKMSTIFMHSIKDCCKYERPVIGKVGYYFTKHCYYKVPYMKTIKQWNDYCDLI